MVQNQQEALTKDQEEVDLNSRSSDDLLLLNRQRRNAVHFASIGEFLSSLNFSDTALTSLQGLHTLSLEHYKSCMRGPEKRDKPLDSSLMPQQQEHNQSEISASSCGIVSEVEELAKPPADGSAMVKKVVGVQ